MFHESGRRVVNVALRVSAKEGKAGRKSREGEPALSHADIRGYPTGESSVTHFHGLLAGMLLILLLILLLAHPPAPRYTVDNGFSLDGHALSSRVPPSSNLRETIPLGWKGIGKRSWKYDRAIEIRFHEGRIIRCTRDHMCW